MEKFKITFSSRETAGISEIVLYAKTEEDAIRWFSKTKKGSFIDCEKVDKLYRTKVFA